MAFDERYRGTFTLNTYNIHQMSNSFYEPDVLDSQLQQSVWGEANMSIDSSETGGSQFAELSDAVSQHWNNDTLWAPTWSLAPCSPSSTIAIEASGFVAPGLSSQSTSRRSSIHPPFTPKSAGRTPSPKRVSFQDAVYVDDRFSVPNGQAQIQETFDQDSTTDQALMGFNYSPHTYLCHSYKAPVMAGFQLGTIQEQIREDYNYTMTRPTLQRTATSPSRRPGSESELAGVWEMNNDRTWSHCDEASAYGARLATERACARSARSHTQVDGWFQDPDGGVDAESKKEYPSVYCEQCGIEFTGKYRASNLGRHGRSKHADGGPRKYECDFCPKIFNRSDALRGHERKKHPSLIRNSIR